jgi:hypothetical protein
MVVWTPEVCMNPQAMTATGTSSHHRVRRIRTSTAYTATAAREAARARASMVPV